MEVKLDYYKTSGKWYGDGCLVVDGISDIVPTIKEAMSTGMLPGLAEGITEFDVVASFEIGISRDQKDRMTSLFRSTTSHKE